MLHLERAVFQFNEISDPRAAEETEMDRQVISAIDGDEGADREAVLCRWLSQYAVLNGYSIEQQQRVCVAILTFADSDDRPSRFTSRAQLIRTFETFERQMKTLTRNLTGKRSDVTALCAQALWCMYPNQMPIYDVNARAALATLSRLMDLPEIDEETEFACYVETWYRVFEQVSPLLDAPELLERYVGPVRCFDRFLWFLGNPLLPCTGGPQITHLRKTIN